MYIRDFMQTHVVTVPSDTLIIDAQKIMQERSFRRLPVVDKGKLVGIVTRTRLRDVAPSQATSLSVWELNYLLSKIRVREVMEKNVVTTTPDATVEEAAMLGAEKGVGVLPVMEGDKLVGIVTQSDLFRLLVGVIGSHGEGHRLKIVEPYKDKPAGGVGQYVGMHNAQILSVYTYMHPKLNRQEMVLRVATDDPAPIVETFRKHGYDVSLT